ncbi:hypothetical protein F5Y07DRAFT_399802 [Xylaria sp. FL0933]|nr:hypothetical protein F5Y07DRAFT_399802 [Xylaria sp. FL0933]
MPISRKKACEQCRLAKTRCSLDPVCLRCLNRGLGCKYSGGSFGIGPYTRPQLPGAEQIPSLAAPVLTTEPLFSQFSNPGPGASSLRLEEVFTEEHMSAVNNSEIDTSWGQVAWNRGMGTPLLSPSRDLSHHEGSHDMPLDLYPTFTIPWDFTRGSRLSSLQSSVLPPPRPDQPIETAAKGLPQPDRPSSPSEEIESPKEIESTIAVYVERYEHLLARRRGATNERPLMAKIIQGQLKNYPMMLIRGSRLPPFIYPQCILNNKLSHSCTAASGTHQCLPEPLANCAALTQMFYSCRSGNSRFVWKAIYDENRRLYKEYPTYDVPTLLAAAQAIVIYILVQAQDTESIARNDIASLAVSLSDMSSSLHIKSKYEDDIYQTPNLGQDVWAICEGIRRTVNLLYVIRIVLLIQIGTHQRCSALLATPLPSGRDLWDPDAAESWAVRLHRHKARMMSSRALIIDDLLCYCGVGMGQSEHNNGASTPIQEDLTTWCESLDGFGTLLWMASLLDR